MYKLRLRKNVESVFVKLVRKNAQRLSIIQKKLQQVLKNPYQFKPLKAPMQNFRRVHIDKSFVVIYRIDEENKAVELWKYDHHDNVYK